MWKYVKPYLHFGILAALCMVGEVLADLAQPTLMSQVVDEGVLGSSGLDAILSLGAAMVGVAIVGGICGSANCAFANLCIQNIGNRMRKDCFTRIMSFSVAQIERFGAGTLITRTTNDVNQVATMIQTLIRGMIRTGMLMFGSIVCVYLLSPIFGMVMLACFPVALAVMLIVMRKVAPLYARIQDALDKLNAIMQEDLNGIRIIKACVRETYEKLRFGKANADLVKNQLKALVLFAFLNPSMSLLMYAAIGVMLALGHSDASTGMTSAGVIIASLSYVTQLLNSMLSLIMISQDLSRGSVSWKRLREILDTEPDIADGTHELGSDRESAATNHASPHEGILANEGARLEFSHVSFSYPESAKKTIDDISFTAEPGQTVGIMGATGCGKSTLAALASRLLDADAGTVRIDGIDVRDWKQSHLRSRVAIALQRAELFSLPVGDVITWGVSESDATRRLSAQEAARIAQADTFVSALPQGYDTVLGERGMSLSGGQRQRLSLARAIDQGAGLVIFDDATSALDLRTEANFYACLQQACPSTTKLIIAQRVASVRHADKIIVLDEGHVVGCGTHEELFESCPAYREIYLSQFEEKDDAAFTQAGEAMKADGLRESTSLLRGDEPTCEPAPRRTPSRVTPGPPGPPRRHEPGEKPEQAKNLRYALEHAMRYFAAEKKLAAAVIAFVIAGVAFGCIAPSIQSTVVDIIAGQSDADFACALTLMLVTYFLYALCQLGDTWLSAHLSQRIVRRLRDELFSKTVDLPVRYLDEHSHGDMMSRMTNDVETISQTISKSLANLISAVLTIVGTAAVMLWMCWQLALLSFSTVILTLAVTRFISHRVLKYSRQKQQLLGQLNGTTEEMINGFRTVIACNRQKKTARDFGKTSDAFTSACLRAWTLSGCMGPIMNCISNIGFVIIAIFGGWFSHAGLITVGVISAFIVYARQFSRPVNALAELYGDLQTAIACAERVFVVLDQESEDMTGSDLASADEATIEFRNVTFGYTSQPVLQDFNLTIPSGKKVALVGATGSGKTTVVNLLERFYDVDAGQILVNGQDIATVARGKLRDTMAIVLQDTMLFTDTIESNLRFANENAADADIARALALTRTDALVDALPQGLDTVLVHAGENLSQGQRQLLSIARAFVADPRILILDEATSNVDTRTEKAVQDAMANVMRGRTCVIIAHRLSTIRDADLIVVLEGGRIVETGTHDQLLAARGRYFQLHQAQFEGFAT